MALCNEIWSLVQYHRWECFCTFPKENVVIPLVQEFYVTPREDETQRPHCVMWKKVIVRVKEVPFSPKKICKFFDVPYYDSDYLENIDLMGYQDVDMETIVKYLTGNRGE